MLIRAAELACAGEPDVDPVVTRQREILQSLACPKALLDPFFDEISDLLRGISRTGSRMHDLAHGISCAGSRAQDPAQGLIGTGGYRQPQ